MNGFLEWLNKELAESETAYTDAETTERAGGFEIDATIERKYWAGYVDALNNVMNEYAGPGAN
jgi:hypothetical protein